MKYLHTKGQISARRRTVDIPDDDILFEFDSEYLDHNASTSDPFDASEFEYEGQFARRVNIAWYANEEQNSSQVAPRLFSRIIYT